MDSQRKRRAETGGKVCFVMARNKEQVAGAESEPKTQHPTGACLHRVVPRSKRFSGDTRLTPSNTLETSYCTRTPNPANYARMTRLTASFTILYITEERTTHRLDHHPLGNNT